MKSVMDLLSLMRVLRAWRREVNYPDVFYARLRRLCLQYRWPEEVHDVWNATDEAKDQFDREFWALVLQCKVAFNISDGRASVSSLIQRL